MSNSYRAPPTKITIVSEKKAVIAENTTRQEQRERQTHVTDFSDSEKRFKK